MFLFLHFHLFFARLVPGFFVTKPTGAVEAAKRPLELLLTRFPLMDAFKGV